MKQTFDYKRFSHAINDKRFEVVSKKKKYYSTRQMGDDIGVSASTLCRVMAGNKVDIDTILLICDWLGKSIQTFIKK